MGDLALWKLAEITGAALDVHEPWNWGSLHKYHLNFKGHGGPSCNGEGISLNPDVLPLPEHPEFSRSHLFSALQI